MSEEEQAPYIAGGEIVTEEAANDLLKRAKPGLKKLVESIPDEKPAIRVAVSDGVEWDGVVEDVGLTGVVIRPVDEHKLWATKTLFPNKTKVRVKVEKL